MPKFVFLTNLYDCVTWNRDVLTLNNILNSANSHNVVTPRNPQGIREITSNDASISVHSITCVHTPETEQIIPLRYKTIHVLQLFPLIVHTHQQMSIFMKQFPNILRFIWIFKAEPLIPWQCKLQIPLQKCHQISTRPHGIILHKTVIFNSHGNYICSMLNQSYLSNNPVTRISLIRKSK